MGARLVAKLADIGGGGGCRERRNAGLTLRWMLREAREAGLVLNAEGAALVAGSDPPAEITPTESRTCCWRLADYVRRGEIHNDYSPARLCFGWGRTGPRRPHEMLRNGICPRYPAGPRQPSPVPSP
jgi:hypothetical protein